MAEAREFDMIIYGATGFTGNFLCEYLAKNYNLIVGKLTKPRRDKQVDFIFLSLILFFFC